MLTNKMATVGDSSFSKSLIHSVGQPAVHLLNDVGVGVKMMPMVACPRSSCTYLGCLPAISKLSGCAGEVPTRVVLGGMDECYSGTLPIDF